MTDYINSKKLTGIPPGRGSHQQELANMTNKQTRRTIVVGAAILPALSLPAFANTDPIFAAIERQKRLWAEWDHETHPEPDFASPLHVAWDKWNHSAGKAYNAGVDDLLATKPTTRAGAAALIACCLSENTRFPEAEEGGDAITLLHTLAEVMPDLA